MQNEIEEAINPHVLLSPLIRLLGNLLGDVIKEQSGLEAFETVERVRHLSKEFRETEDPKKLQELRHLIETLEDPQKSIVIKAFSMYFQLVNIAEDRYKILTDQISRLKMQLQATDSLPLVIKNVKKNNVSISRLLEIIESGELRLVMTAHPTEARRHSVLTKLRRISQLLARYDYERPVNEQYAIRSELKEQITLLWQSDELREEKISVLDEVRSLLYYFSETIFEVVPQVLNLFKESVKESYCYSPSPFEIPDLLSFGSWVGGDRDGHPGVTSKITLQTLLLHKRLCLRKYLRNIQKLLEQFSVSTNIVSVSDHLLESIKQDEERFPEYAVISKALNPKEPYRRKLDFIRMRIQSTLLEIDELAEKIGMGKTLVGSTQFLSPDLSSRHAYPTCSEFLQDLRIIYDSLIENKGKAIAEGKLNDLILQARTFGFFLAHLDIRQESTVHLRALDEIFRNISLPSLINLPSEERIRLIRQELINPRPLGVKSITNRLTDETKELFETLSIIGEAKKIIAADAIESYIISMCRDEADILGLLLLMKEQGLVILEKNQIKEAYLDIVPLFETREDLNNAPQVMERLFTDPLYRSYIEARNMVQEVMLGYSDSSKDVGYFESNYHLRIAQEQLIKIANKHGIGLRIFHGRGGTISRGGGPTNRALLSQPKGGVQKVKITEQGEVIAANYSSPEIAKKYIEQVISAVILRRVEDEIEDSASQNNNYYLERMRKIGEKARETYEDLVKHNPYFIDFFQHFTPIDLIEHATIGSRPTRRKKEKSKSISNLRAIPWVFSWMQTRLLFPGFYGSGSALKEIIEEEGEEVISEMYQKWPYFRTLIDNLQMVLLKVDLPIAEQYTKLIRNSPHLQKIYNKIIQEYNKSVTEILRISQCGKLLSGDPFLRQSILRRNPYLDPLNLSQVILLEKWREKNRPIDLSPGSLLRELLLTVNGVAAGMKNTG